MKKTELRQKAIRELIQTQAVENQQDLVKLLNQNYKIETNQSIVSRDLRNMGIIKNEINGQFFYETKKIDVSREILRLAITDIQHNESLIVVKTIGGLAAFVADYLDAQENGDILATIAGENVVFVTPLSVKKIEKLFLEVIKLLHFKHSNKGKI